MPPAGGLERLVHVAAPQSDIGAPLPHILADDYHLAFAYMIHVPDPDWDGTTVRTVSGNDEHPCAVVVARNFFAVRFGPPNDEAMRGHRLAALGIKPYSSYAVDPSCWIGELERANRVHSNHDPSVYRRRRHFIFTFHDTTLEFVAEGFSVEVRTGLLRRLLAEAFERAGRA